MAGEGMSGWLGMLGSLFGSTGGAGQAANGVQSMANPSLSGASGGGFMDMLGQVSPDQWMKIAQMFADPNDPKSKLYGAIGGVLDASKMFKLQPSKSGASKQPTGSNAQLPADSGMTNVDAAAAQGLNPTNMARASAAGGMGPQDMSRAITRIPSMADYASGPSAQGAGQPYTPRMQPAFSQPLGYLGAQSLDGYLVRRRNGY